MTAPRYTADDYESVADAVMEGATCDHRSIGAMLRQAAETERALTEFRAWLIRAGLQLKPALDELDRRFGRTP